MTVTAAQIKKIAKTALNSAAERNMLSVLTALEGMGPDLGLDQPHRLAQFLAQIMHESGEFRYDRELWGPTPAQQRYDTRADLGNTPAKDGDGEKYKGRTAIQITGKSNYEQFWRWCSHYYNDVPNFVDDPDAVNRDPWEGLGPLWYWDTRKLNKYADQGDIEMVTKRINGGLNGYADRLDYYARAALVLLGYGVSKDDLRRFQREHGLEADGIAGPRTRAVMHKALLSLSPAAYRMPDVKLAPVTVEKPVAPKQLDKPVTKTTGFWERLVQLLGLSGIGGAAFMQDWRTVAVVAGVLILVAIVGLILHKRIIDAVRTYKTEIG